MRSELLLGGTVKTYKSVDITYDVTNIDNISATMVPPALLPDFEFVTVERDGAEIFGGIADTETSKYAADGSDFRIEGNDYRIKLLQYYTPVASVAGTTTLATLGTILLDSPIEVDVDGAFGYITEVKTWDTWVEFTTEIDTFSNTTVEIDLQTVELNSLVNDGTWTGCISGLKSCFFYDGTTQRYYIFVKNATDDLYYYHSTDGVNWTGVDSLYQASGDTWSVAWKNSKVYLFLYTGIATRILTGAVNDGTGAITWTSVNTNIFSANSTMLYGPVWDDQGDIWVIRNNAGGQAYESTNDGANWNYRFGPGDTSLHAILPFGSDGDMYGFVYDLANTDTEEWIWDRSAGTFTFNIKVTDDGTAPSYMDGCSDALYNPYIMWVRTGTITKYSDKLTGSWGTHTLSSTGVEQAPTISCDGYRNVYMSWTAAGGYLFQKYTNGSFAQNTSVAHGQPAYNSSPRSYLQDGNIAVFFAIVDSGTDDIYMGAFAPVGIRLVEGAATGYFQSDAIAASGAFVDWGWLTGDGIELDDILWDILKSSDDSILAEDQYIPFDLGVAGVPPTETSIKIRADLTDTGTDPYIFEYTLSEKTDSVYRDFDYENCFDAVNWLSGLAGAETYVTYSGGTYTLHFVTSRGSDKSNTVLLKTGYVNLYPDTPPNIKAVSHVYDRTAFANSVRVIGGLEGVTRVDVTLQDWTDIASRGEEYWALIRDNDITTTGMGRTRAAIELSQRNNVVERIEVEFVDPYIADMVEIGDTIHLAAHFVDENLDIDGDYRIITLTRRYGTDGETVSASLTNRMKYTEFWNYMKKTDTLERWATT